MVNHGNSVVSTDDHRRLDRHSEHMASSSDGLQSSTPASLPYGVSSDLDVIGPDEWSSLVTTMLDSDRAEIISWGSEQILRGVGTGTRLYRTSGTAARGNAGPIGWSMIVKFFTFDIAVFETLSESEQDWNYWKREWLAYQSSWQQNLTGSLVAPRCYGHSTARPADAPSTPDRTELIAWIALEDLGDHTVTWTPPEFAALARHAGEFNGTHPTGMFDDAPWLAHNWLRGWTEQAAPAIAQLSEGVDGDIAQRVLPAEITEQLLQLWADREQLLRALDQLPVILGHNDLFPRNVFRRDSVQGERTVAIDWPYVGPTPIGAELASMVGASQVFFGSPPDEWEDLEQACLTGYRRGLDQVGYGVDPADIEAGYLLSYALRFGVGVTGHTLDAALLPVEARPEFSRTVAPYDDLIDRIEAQSRFRQVRIDRARALLGL